MFYVEKQKFELKVAFTLQVIALVSLSAYFMILDSANVIAQAKGPKNGADTSLTVDTTRTQGVISVIEADIGTIIERHIPREAFQVIVKASLKKSKRNLSSYLPENLSTATSRSWQDQVENVKVEVRLAKRYGKETEASLSGLLVDKLGITRNSITFSKLQIELPPARSELEMQLQKAEADARNAKNLSDQLTREREDVKRELASTKSQLDKKSGSGLGGSSFESYTTIILILTGLLILVSIIFVALSVRTSANALGSAVRVVAESIPTLGDKMIEAASQQGLNAGEQSVKVASEREQIAASSQNGGSALAGVPLDSLHARLLAVHEELKATINTNNEFVVIRFLNHMLKDEALIGKAVVSLEILGKDLANHLYARLASEDQEKVSKFLQSGTHSRSKWELMLEAGEEVKTKLMAEGMNGIRGKINDKIAERVLNLRTGDISSILSKIDVSAVPRMFLYLEPQQLAEVLMMKRSEDPDQFKNLSASVLKVAESLKEEKRDAEILQAINAHEATQKEDIQRPFLSYYKSVVELLDDNSAEEVASIFASGGPTLESFIQENIITFATFLRIQPELQESILEGLSNKDLAALFVSLADDQSEVLKSMVSDQRMELIVEELERLRNKGQRSVDQAHSNVKRVVVKKLMTLKGDGPISDLFANKQEGDKSKQAA